MNVYALCIRRPVMVILLALALILVGLLAWRRIPVSALPAYNSPFVSVTAHLDGANPDTMASSVALPLEKQLSDIAGLTNMTSTSVLGDTTLTLEFDSSVDVNAASVDVQAALLRAQRSLPVEMTEVPSYRKVNPADLPILSMAINSPSLSLAELDDFAENVIAPELSTLPGVAQVVVNGAKRYAVRIRAKPEALEASNLTFDEVANAVRAANSASPLGMLDGPAQALTVHGTEPMKRAADFANLIVASREGQTVRLGDVATVDDSYQSEKKSGSYNGERSILLTVQRQPNANTVQVVDAVRRLLPHFQAVLPASIHICLVNDRSVSIREAMGDVRWTLLLSILLVVLVTWLFLRRAAATFIPAITMPISLLGALALLYALGDGLDNISLLGITLAVGLVVDDAIVVLENIVRHLELGKAPLQAAFAGSREMGFTIVSISVSLVAVFIPIFFMPGPVGLLFHEFAVVVSLAIAMSALLSLTLVPMLASRLLPRRSIHRTADGSDMGRWLESVFERLVRAYAKSLDRALHHRGAVLLVGAAALALTVTLYSNSPKGFFPAEDLGQVNIVVESAEDTSTAAMLALQERVASALLADPSVQDVTSFASGGNRGNMFVVLKPRSKRPPMATVLASLRRAAANVPGIATYMSPVQNLQIGGRATKSRFQYTLQSVSPGELDDWAGRYVEMMRADPIFRDVASDSQAKGLQVNVQIDRDKASTEGISVADIRSALYDAFGERQVSTIFGASAGYAVILEATDTSRQFEDSIARLSVRGSAGALVPLSSFVSVHRTSGPTAINHLGQLQAITLSFNLADGVPLSVATQHVDRMRDALNLPASVIPSWGGEAAAFQDSQSSQIVIFVAALAVIYVLLGVLYESFIHPLTILAGLPSAAVGALLALRLCGMDLTTIAGIGILMLIGIVKKNAIMMIDFALQMQRDAGSAPAEAIRQACILRFRPITMTTLAAMGGALPIALGLGAGAELRQPLGIAVIGGLLLSQAMTLYITPVIYLLLDRFSGAGPMADHHLTEQPSAASQTAPTSKHALSSAFNE